MVEQQTAVETLVRGAHDQIIEGLMGLTLQQLEAGLLWSQQHYSKLDVERLLQLAIDLHKNPQ
ncbi:MAG: hypothetical protein EBS77_06605 [Gammaproteobacteria bacterium]|nr:hypothetical protein [Gammaproteobacteria bacterium]